MRASAPLRDVVECYHERMNRLGITLVELLISIVLLALLSAIAIPKIAAFLTAGDRRLAKEEVIRALDLTRGMAIRLGEPVQLHHRGNELIITTTSDTTPVWTSPNPMRRGFSVAGLQRSVAFGPDGLGWGAANRSVVVSRNGVADRVILSRLGRLRQDSP